MKQATSKTNVLTIYIATLFVAANYLPVEYQQRNFPMVTELPYAPDMIISFP